ncbi:MAG: class I tRNA ligase family protein, partial [Actinobacteria bacterium]|nr:class I tRNA ligase family protein [Actinomycetota bacterium]
SKELQSYLGDEPLKESFDEIIDKMLLLLSPMAPHLAHELWEMRGHDTMLAFEPWPMWDEQLVREETVTMIVQVNGKVRDRVEVSTDITAEEAEEHALSLDKIRGWIDGHEVRKVIVRQPNLVNIVIG